MLTYQYAEGPDVVTGTFTDNPLDFNLRGTEDGRPIKIILTVTNIYTPPVPTEPQDEREPREDREPNPTVVVTPEETPLAIPTVTITPPVVAPEIIEEIVPLDVPVLPKTGELPPALFYGIGSMISGLGLLLRRKKKASK